MNIRLIPMTKDLCRKYQQGLENDPMLYADMSKFKPFEYCQEKCDAYFERYVKMSRKHLAIMLDNEPIGEVILKNFNHVENSCGLGICLVNDSVKNRGYGTRAEILALEYAFEVLGIKVVYADSLLKNKRSQHVLEKVGFQKTGMDDSFVYYRCDRDIWSPLGLHKSGAEDSCRSNCITNAV